MALKVSHSVYRSDKLCILKAMLINLCADILTHIMNHSPHTWAAGVGCSLVAQKQITQGSQPLELFSHGLWWEGETLVLPVSPAVFRRDRTQGMY